MKTLIYRGYSINIEAIGTKFGADVCEVGHHPETNRVQQEVLYSTSLRPSLGAAIELAIKVIDEVEQQQQEEEKA